MIEDGGKLAFYEKPMGHFPQRSKWQLVFHTVVHGRAITFGRKGVCMMPIGVWTGFLRVDKPVGRLGNGDQCDPFKRNTQDRPYGVCNAVPFMEGTIGKRIADHKPHSRGCDPR